MKIIYYLPALCPVNYFVKTSFFSAGQMADGPGICACRITFLSLLMVLVTFPLSLLFTVKVVQVIFLTLR